MIYRLLLKIIDVLTGIQFLLSRLFTGQKQILANQEDQARLLEEVLFWVKPKQATQVRFMVTYENEVLFGVTQMIMKVHQQFDVIPVFLDKWQNPAPVHGIPVWSNSNEASLSLVVAADGLSAHIESLSVVGTGQIAIQADADLGEGVKLINGVMDVDVQPGEAAFVQLNAGPVSDIEAAPEVTPH